MKNNRFVKCIALLMAILAVGCAENNALIGAGMGAVIGGAAGFAGGGLPGLAIGVAAGVAAGGIGGYFFKNPNAIAEANQAVTAKELALWDTCQRLANTRERMAQEEALRRTGGVEPQRRQWYNHLLQQSRLPMQCEQLYAPAQPWRSESIGPRLASIDEAFMTEYFRRWTREVVKYYGDLTDIQITFEDTLREIAKRYQDGRG